MHRCKSLDYNVTADLDPDPDLDLIELMLDHQACLARGISKCNRLIRDCGCVRVSWMAVAGGLDVM